MQSILRVPLIAMVITAVGAVAADPVRAPFSIKISTEHSNVAVGTEVRIRIVLTNMSDHKILLERSVGNNEGEVSNNLDIFCSDGKSAPKTKHYMRLRGEFVERDQHGIGRPSFIGGMYGEFVEPGKNFEDNIIVNHNYDLSQPGKYTIQVSRFDPAYSKTWVKSN